MSSTSEVGASKRGAVGEPSPHRDHHVFRVFAVKTAAAMGTPWAFVLALATIVVWALSGPLFHYSDTWQLVINTGTTIVTFLMVFVIQHTQNRDTAAMRVKVDELIRAVHGARNSMINAEELEDEELEQLLHELQSHAAKRGRERERERGR